MKVTKNSSPSSEWEHKDRCPSCGSFCDIHKDIDENDECNDCRSSKTAVEFLVQELFNNGYFHYGVPSQIVEQAKQMEKEQIEKACEFGRAFGYNQAIGYPQPFKTPTTYYNETYKNTNE